MTSYRSDPQVISINLADGNPYGVIAAEANTSKVVAIAASRTLLQEMLARPEAEKAGVYMLLGPVEDGEARQKLYVGEAKRIKNRILQHDRDSDKAFFRRAVYVVTSDNTMIKYREYLESRLYTRVDEAKRVDLHNTKIPSLPDMHKNDKIVADGIFYEIEMLLPVLGFDCLKLISDEIYMTRDDSNTDYTTWYCVGKEKQHDYKAMAREVNGDFVLLPGSTIRGIGEEPGSTRQSLCDLRKSAMDKRGQVKKIAVDEGKAEYRVVEHIPFDSPSGAASFVRGYGANGNTEWKDKNGKTYGEVRHEKLKVQLSDAVQASESMVECSENENDENKGVSEVTSAQEQRKPTEKVIWKCKDLQENFNATAVEQYYGEKNFFVVQKGSIVRPVGNETPSAQKRGLTDRRRKYSHLLKKIDDEHYETTQDIEFDSPSSAVEFVCGSVKSGPLNWYDDKSGKLYAELMKKQ